jgi:hypothetical protein
MNTGDVFVIVRGHRWMSADKQADAMREPKPKAVWSLDGGKKLPACTLRDLEKWATPGRVFRVYHLFLLADPAKRTPLMVERLLALVHKLVDRRGVVIEDAFCGLSTAHKGQKSAMLALAKEMIARSCKGARSAVNGKKSKGRPLAFSAAQIDIVEAEWFNARHATNEAALKAMAKQGVKISETQAWREMEKRRGRGKGGSGRPYQR